MFRIEEYSDKPNTYGVMIHSFESYERIKKWDEQERANNPEKPYDTVVSNKLRMINLFVVARKHNVYEPKF